MSDSIDFPAAFCALTGNDPLSWQKRLYRRFIKGNDLPGVIDLPTGLGKTMVMVIWLIARANHPDKVPTRLIYVVDRRTVVDQASDIAVELAFLLAPDDDKEFEEVAKQKPELAKRKNGHADILSDLGRKLHLDGRRLAVSTLRGQLADNREWSRDPSCPAIIIGTVDLIGSGLLFSGYRSGFKTKPLHAGLLGQDSLLVLDEAHLSKPFEKLLIGQLREDGSRENGIVQFQAGKGQPMRVLRMSATSAADDTSRFKLEESDLNDKVIEERFNARKSLTIETTDDVIGSIAAAAGKIASDKPGSRIVIFVKSPKDVQAVRTSLIRKDESRKIKIAMLTGTMRGLERDELLMPPTREDQNERRVMQRFLKPDNDPSLGECFLISTSAGEVGFDLNADHMVCDATTVDSFIQRLGRVNRRGLGDAHIYLFVEAMKKEKDGKSKKLEGLGLAIANTIGLLQGVVDVGPNDIAALKTDKWKDRYADACSPRPITVDLTDILLDVWSMTSVTKPMPGRPGVAPWLRGIADDLPQTTVAWRAELDLPGFAEVDTDTIEEWFDTHRILTHETLSVPTTEAAKQILARWNSFDEARQNSLGALRVVVDQAGFKVVRLSQFINALERDSRQASKSYDTIRYAELVLPASFGAIERGAGLLNASAPEVPKKENEKPIDDQRKAYADRLVAPDVADIAPGRERLRQFVIKPEDGKVETRTIGNGTPPRNPLKFRVDLESDDDERLQLISYIPGREKPERGLGKPETLASHVGKVRKAVDAIITRFSQANSRHLSDIVVRAAKLAADWHDHGKNREFFERTVGGTCTPGTTDWMKQETLDGNGSHQCLGKSDGKDRGRAPRGYRHEFGSLRELSDSNGTDITREVIDLALHLVAVHHGRGRPHFPKGGFDPDCESRSEEIHIESIRRFARLQRKYGWWHLAWLENLLRCADAMASSEQDAVGGEI